jgi:hypothetical protein
LSRLVVTRLYLRRNIDLSQKPQVGCVVAFRAPRRGF